MGAWRTKSGAIGTTVGLLFAGTSAAVASSTHTTTSGTHAAPAAIARPDPTLHPGKVDTSLTRAKLCDKNSKTSDRRPPTSYTDKIKRLELGVTTEQVTAPDGRTFTVTGEHLPGAVGDYELDHLISLELGGDPEDPENLWMEP